MVFSPKVLTDCNFNHGVILVTTIFPPPPSQLRGFLPLSCMDISYSRDLVAILVLTLIDVKYILGFRRDVVSLLR